MKMQEYTDAQLFTKLKQWSKNNVVKVKFEKKDGSKRVMLCTRRGDFYPNYEFSAPGYMLDMNQHVPVWDVEKRAWRSVRKGTIEYLECLDNNVAQSYLQ